MHASYKMQIVPENGSLLNSRCTYSLAVLNHTGEALSQRQYKIMKEQALAAQLPRWPHRLLTTSAHFRTCGPRAGLRRRKWQKAVRNSEHGKTEETTSKPVFQLRSPRPCSRHWLTSMKNVIGIGLSPGLKGKKLYSLKKIF